MTVKKGYFETLESNNGILQQKLNKIIIKNLVQPVGNSYIDMIILKDKSQEFINDLTRINIAVESISWWCFCNEKNKELLSCPHGYGGPKSHFYQGWFSEMGNYNDIEREALHELEENFTTEKIKEINKKALKIIKEINNDKYFTECLTSGIWAYVPDDWKREE